MKVNEIRDLTPHEEIERLMRERDDARNGLERSTDWYQQRFNRLRRWVEEEVRPLSDEVARRYYSICANGSPAPHESADWQETMHRLTLERDALKRAVDGAMFEIECLKARQPLSMVETCRASIERGAGRCGACADCVGNEREAVIEAMELLADVFSEHRSGNRLSGDLVDIRIGCWLAKHARSWEGHD